MKTVTRYTDLPAELHRQTLYDWGSRGLRTYHGFRVKGATGRPRCTFDPAWRHQFDAIPARSGQSRLLRRISSQTTEWVAVARRRGQFWVVAYYLVPKSLNQGEAADQIYEIVPSRQNPTRTRID